MAGKRVSLASLAGAKVEAVPGAGRPDLIHVHPDTVAPTPLNPRRAFDETELTELGEDMRGGQLQPCVAVTKAAYLKLYPDHAEQLPESCRYVMAAGERRWRAALKVGLDSLDVMLRHDLTESRVRFLAAVLSENVQRANFNPIEEADGLRAMLELHDGNQAAAARAMGKSKAWFNQRIGLLRLSDEMVELVLTGKLTAFRDMRRYAAMPPEEQYRAWKLDQERPAQPEPEPQVYTAVYPPEPAGADAEPVASGPEPDAAMVPNLVPPQHHREPQAYTAVYAPRRPAPAVAPEQRASTAPGPGVPARQSSVPDPGPARQPDPGPSGEHKPVMFPYGDGAFAAQLLIDRMPEEEFAEMMDVLDAHRAQRQAATG